jgi:hypothetical protein
MAVRTARILAALAILVMSLPVAGNAAGTVVRARFSFDALATCTKPAVENFKVHAEGSGTLSTDRTATLDMSSNIQSRETYTAKLGGGPTEAVGGSASLRVVNRHTLRAVREYPNNMIIATMTVIGNSCRLSIDNRLKPGKREYTFYGNGGVAICSRPRMTHAECTPY